MHARNLGPSYGDQPSEENKDKGSSDGNDGTHSEEHVACKVEVMKLWNGGRCAVRKDETYLCFSSLDIPTKKILHIYLWKRQIAVKRSSLRPARSMHSRRVGQADSLD